MISVAGGAMSGLAVQILAWRGGGGMVLEIITFTIGSLNRVYSVTLNTLKNCVIMFENFICTLVHFTLRTKGMNFNYE